MTVYTRFEIFTARNKQVFIHLYIYIYKVTIGCDQALLQTTTISNGQKYFIYKSELFVKIAMGKKALRHLANKCFLIVHLKTDQKYFMKIIDHQQDLYYLY